MGYGSHFNPGVIASNLSTIASDDYRGGTAGISKSFACGPNGLNLHSRPPKVQQTEDNVNNKIHNRQT